MACQDPSKHQNVLIVFGCISWVCLLFPHRHSGKRRLGEPVELKSRQTNVSTWQHWFIVRVANSHDYYLNSWMSLRYTRTTFPKKKWLRSNRTHSLFLSTRWARLSDTLETRLRLSGNKENYRNREKLLLNLLDKKTHLSKPHPLLQGNQRSIHRHDLHQVKPKTTWESKWS